MQKMMILGSQGMLGMEMTYYFQNKFKVIPLDYFNLDITNKKLVQETISKYQPDIIINCAAYTDVERAEAKYERDQAMKINGEAVGFLAEECSKKGITFVQLSTDYVFDGTKKTLYLEDDLPNPLNVYGKSKLLGEQKVLEFAQSNSDWTYYIVRTAWLYGQYGPNFVKKMLHKSRNQKILKIVSDQTGSPTWTLALTKGIDALLEQKKYTKGIYHLTGNGQTTWADFAIEIFKLRGLSTQVTKVDSSEFSQIAVRPEYSVLQNTKGPQLQKWEEMLQEYLKCS